MSEIIERNELKDSLSKCRCCLRLLIDDRRVVEMNETIQEQFFNLTNLSVRK
jgi:chromosomal replication initiation ATPase DnaA